MSMERYPILQEREKTHGSFMQNADCSQKIKAIMRCANGGLLCAVHREALDMIALKISRICTGQANFKDHWKDLAGYAKLGEEACDG